MLRWRRMGRRFAIDAALLLFALIFLLAAFSLGHVAIFLTIAPHEGSLNSVLFILAGDVVLAVLLGGSVVVNGPGRVERQALEVRQTARLQLAQSLSTGALIASAMRAIGARQVVSLLRTVFELLGNRAK